MKNAVIVILAVILLGGAGAAGWYFFLKKSPEGGACQSAQRCKDDMKCVTKICSSGKVGSVCETKADCQTDFCAIGKCSEGKVGDTCLTYKDCQNGLYCQSSICASPPSYTKYFSKIEISKIRQGASPGPNNIPVPTTEFKKTDAIEIDVVPLAETNGELTYELVNAVTGVTEISNDNSKMPIKGGQPSGTGFGLPNNVTGEFELKIYFNDETVMVAFVKVSP